MNWQTYKALCDRPDIWSAWMLDQCEELLTYMHENKLLGILQAGRAATSLPVPDGHHGPSATRMYQLSLDVDQRQQILTVVLAAIAGGVTTTATRQRGLAGFAEAWQEFVDYSH